MTIGGNAAAGRDFRLSPGVARDPVVWAWVTVAAALQVLYVLLASPPTDVGDQFEYAAIADGFGSWWATPNTEMLRMPAYPFVLALLHEAGWGGPAAIQVLQIGLISGCVLLVASFGASLGGRRTARVAAALFATYLPLLSFSSVRLTEALTVACVLGATACALRAADRTVSTWAWWCVGAAVLMAAAFMTRPGSLGVSLALVALLVVSRKSRTERVAVVLLVVAAFSMALGPWVGRNQALSGALLPAGTTGAYPAALGVHLPFDREVGQFATQTRSVRFWSGKRPDGFGPRQAEAMDRRAVLWENLTEHTGEFLVTRAVGQFQLWAWPVTAKTQYGQHDVPYPPLMGWHLALIVGGLVGFWRRRDARIVRIGAAAVLVTAGLHLVTFPQPRYALMAMPYLIVGFAALVTPGRMPAGGGGASPEGGVARGT